MKTTLKLALLNFGTGEETFALEVPVPSYPDLPELAALHDAIDSLRTMVRERWPRHTRLSALEVLEKAKPNERWTLYGNVKLTITTTTTL